MKRKLSSDGVEYSTFEYEYEYEYRKKTSSTSTSTSTDIEKCTRVRVP